MALGVIWLSVVLGAMLGLWQRATTRATGPIRTFAVVAATLVVGLSLLPHALASEGLWGLAAAAAGLFAIPAVDRVVKALFRGMNTGRLRLEVGYVGLFVHRIGDGVVMAVEGHGNELLWAVGAHEIPIVALVTLVYARRGVPEALLRAAVLGVASSLGYWLASSMPGSWHHLHGWADAVAAGILIHIVAHEALAEKLHSARERAFDVLAGLLGLLIVLLPSAEHVDAAPSLGQRLLAHSLDAAPMLGIGLLATASLLANGLCRRQAPSGRIVALACVMAAPAFGFEAILLSTRLMGWPFAVLRLTGALALALALAGALSWMARGAARPVDSEPPTEPQSTRGVAPFSKRCWLAFEELLLKVGGYMLLGLLGASYIEAFVPPHALALASAAWQLGVLGALAVPSSVCAAAAIPLAAALVGKGLHPGIALGGLMLGSAANLTALGWARSRIGTGRLLAALAIMTLAAWSLGVLASTWIDLSASLERARGAGPLEWLALGVLGALLARSIWQVGIRGWLGVSLGMLAGTVRRDHALEVHAH